MSEQGLLTVGDVAALAQLSTKTIRRAIDRGDLAASKLGGRVRIRREDVDDWIERSRIPAARRTPLPARSAAANNGLRELLRRPSA